MVRNPFGTDGVRRTANTVPASVHKLAMAVGQCFRDSGCKERVVIRKDTPSSTFVAEVATAEDRMAAIAGDLLIIPAIPAARPLVTTRSLPPAILRCCKSRPSAPPRE